MQRDSFRHLLQKAQAGDRKAMDQALAALRPYLEKIARAYANPVRPIQSTADLLQESCLRAWNKIGPFEGGTDDEDTFAIFRAWMAQIVRRMGQDAKRDHNRQRRRPDQKILRLGEPLPGEASTAGGEFEAVDKGHSPSSYARADEMKDRVRAALRDIPDELNSRIVRMCIFEGLNLTEIAERLDLGYDKVRKRYLASIESIKRELKDWI